MPYRERKKSDKSRRAPVKRNGIRRVEQQIITSRSPLYPLIDNYCFRAKNVYNAACQIIKKRSQRRSRSKHSGPTAAWGQCGTPEDQRKGYVGTL